MMSFMKMFLQRAGCGYPIVNDDAGRRKEMCEKSRTGGVFVLTFLISLLAFSGMCFGATEPDPARISEIEKNQPEQYPDMNSFRKPDSLQKLVLAHRNPWFPMDREAMLWMCGADRLMLEPTGDPLKDMVIELECAKN